MPRTRSTARLLLVSALLACAYLVAGRASILLAVPPAFASPVWPPAGLALAAALLLGRGVFPGLFLGAFLIELYADRPGMAEALRVPVAMAVGAGVVLQVVCAMALVRWASGPGNPLDRTASMVPVIVLGGPVACTVSATVATSALWAAGMLHLEDVAYTWGSWWVGDSVGVVFIAPMLLAWFARPAEVWRRRRATVVGPLVVAFALVVGLYVDTSMREAERVKEAFDDRARALAGVLAHHLDVQVALVRSMEGLFAASLEVTPAEFDHFTKFTRPNAPGLLAQAWAPVLTDGGGLHVPVTFVEPRAGNESMLGIDLAAEPRRRAAVEHALALQAPAASAPVRLVAGQKHVSVLIVSPVVDRRGTDGVVVAVVDLSEFVARTLEDVDHAGIRLRLVDVGTEEVVHDEGASEAKPLWVGEIPCGGRTWRAEMWSTVNGHLSWFSWLVLVGGLVVAGLLVTVIVEVVTRSVMVEQLVTSRTAELERANAALLRTNVDLERFAYVASHDMREPLRVVTTYSELLAEEVGPDLPDEPRRRLSRVIENARRMQALVSGLLEHARAGGRAEPFRPTDLGALARAAIDDLSASIQESGARITVRELPTVACDPSRMLQVFRNLLGNALKFRRPGVPPDVSIEARHVDGAWDVSVRDNGEGVPPEHRERVFELFQRLHPRERFPGAGLGLATSRQAIEHHGGKIWIEGTDGPGTVVHFTLPDSR